MRLFSIRGAEVKCSLLLAAAAPFFAVLAGWRTFLTAFLSLCVHEAAHAMAAARLGYRVAEIELLPFGFRASLDCAEASPADAAAIFAAGPAASLSMAAMSALMEGLFPIYASAELGMTEFNLITAAVNLLPAVPLDGGRLVFALFSGRGRRIALKCLKASGFLTGAVFTAAFAMLLAGRELNPTLLLMGVFLMISSLRERAPGAVPKRRPKRLPLPVRHTAMAGDTDIASAIGALPAGSYSVVCVLDGEGGIAARLDESDLWDAALMLGSSAKLADAVALNGRKVL